MENLSTVVHTLTWVRGERGLGRGGGLEGHAAVRHFAWSWYEVGKASIISEV